LGDGKWLADAVRTVIRAEAPWVRGEQLSLVERCSSDIHLSTITNAMAISLSVIGVTVPPVPVDGLLPGTQLNESPLLVVLGLIPLVRTIFVGVPVVIVLVALVVVPLVVLALSIFMVLIILRAGSGHHRNRRGKGSSQKK
jgi:hypothetical protein